MEAPLRCTCGHNEKWHIDWDGDTHECTYSGCHCVQFQEVEDGVEPPSEKCPLHGREREPGCVKCQRAAQYVADLTQRVTRQHRRPREEEKL